MLEDTPDAAEEGFTVRNYQGVQESRFQVHAGSVPFLEDSSGRWLSMMAFVFVPSGLFRQPAPVAKLKVERESHVDYRRSP